MSPVLIICLVLGSQIVLWGGLFGIYLYLRRVKKIDLAPGWWVICHKCRLAHRLGDLGGVRLAPPSRQFRLTWVPCPRCQQRTRHYKLHEHAFGQCPIEPDFGNSAAPAVLRQASAEPSDT